MFTSKIKRTGRAVLAAALLALAAASTTSLRAAAPAVLGELPADSRAVIVINNVKDLGTKISNLGVRAGLPLPPDLVGYVTRLAGITKGFDPNSSAALAFLPPSDEQQQEAGPPPMVVLLPTTDAKAMLASFEPGDADKDGISEVTLPGDRGEKGYTATVDKWVVLAQDRTALAAYLKHKNSLDKTLPAQTLKTFEKNDLVVWGNIPALTKGADKFLDTVQPQATGMLELANLSANLDPMQVLQQKIAVSEMFVAARQYIKDADAAMITLRLSDAGTTFGLIGTFKPDSPFGKFIAAQKPAQPLTLDGLPSGAVLAAGALAWDGPSVAKLIGDISDRAMADENIAKSPKAKELKSLFDLYRQGAALTTGESFVLLAPPAPPADAAARKNGVFNGAAIIDSPDPAKLMAFQIDVVKAQALANALGTDIHQDVAVTPDAVTVKGTKFTKIHMTFKLREEPPGGDKPVSEMAKQQFKMVQAMYGPDGVTVYSGVVGKRCLVAIGADNLDAAVAAAESNSKDLANNPMIAAARDQLAAGTVAAGYVDVIRLVAFIQPMMADFMPPGAMPALPPIPPPAPGATAPVVASAGIEGSTLTMELHVPTTTVVTVKDTVMHMLAPAGPGPGGAAPAPDGGMQP